MYVITELHRIVLKHTTIKPEDEGLSTLYTPEQPAEA